jgi:hypothetical protein
MRKILSLGLLGLISFVSTASVLADGLEECEELKEDGSPRALYALCIAEARAGNDNAEARIIENQEKMLSEDCPCWAADDLAGFEQVYRCEHIAITGTDFEWHWAQFEKDYPEDDAVTGPEDVTAVAGFVPVQDFPDSTSCLLSRTNAGEDYSFSFATNDEQDDNCRRILLEVLCQ